MSHSATSGKFEVNSIKGSSLWSEKTREIARESAKSLPVSTSDANTGQKQNLHFKLIQLVSIFKSDAIHSSIANIRRGFVLFVLEKDGGAFDEQEGDDVDVA